MEFVIPQHPEDLEVAKQGRVSVTSVLDVENCADIDSVIDGVAAAVLDSNNIFQTVISSTVFDNVYSFIKYWSCHSGAVKQRVIELLVSLVQEHMGALHESKSDGLSPGEANKQMAERRTAFKATMYLYAIGVQVADKTSVPQGTDALAGGKKGKGSKLKGKKAADDDDFADDEPAEAGADSGAWDWSAFREPCLRLLMDLLCVDMRKLWPLGVPEEEIIGVAVKTGARVLGNALAMKDKACRRAVVELLATACRRYPSIGTAAVVAVVDAVTKAEHAVGVAVDLVELMSAGLTPQGTLPDAFTNSNNEEGAAGILAGLPHGGRYFAPAAAAELLREVGRVNTGSGSSEASAGLKRASSFIQEVSERCPPLVLANLACLLPHLDSDNATLRSALVATLGNIVARSYNAATAEAAAKAAAAAAAAAGGDPEAAAAQSASFSTRTRDALLDALAERVHDVHSYTRAAALRAWVALASSAAVPTERFPSITALAVGRLMDKGGLVRKAAAQLVRTLLEANPFGTRIDPALFSAQLAQVDAWLVANAPVAVLTQKGLAPAQEGGASAGAGAGASASSKSFKASKKPTRKGLAVDDDDEDDEAEDDVTEALLADAAADMEAEAAGGKASDEVEVAISPEVAQYCRYHDGLTSALAFANSLLGALPLAVELLSSKTASDVREAIKLLSRARAFGVPGAEGSLARMLVLVWSDEAGVRDEVVDTFDALYLRDEALADDDEDEAGAGNNGLAPAAGAAAAGAAAEAEAEPEAAPARPKRSTRAKSSVADDDDEDGDDNAAAEDDDEDDEDKPKKGGKKKTAAKPKAKAAATQASKTAATADASASAAAPAKAKKKRSARSSSSTLDPVLVATNLVSLLAGAPLAVRTSLEEVLREAASQEMLPPGLGTALWQMVGEGVAALHRARVEVGVCLIKTKGGEGPTFIPATQQLLTAADAVLSRARAAMAILSMVGQALQGTLDSTESLACMAAVLRQTDGTNVPVGASLLRAAVRNLSHPSVTPAGAVPDLRLVDMALSVGDYRMAKHACVALQKVKGYSVAVPPRKVMAGAASAPAEADGAAGKAKGAKGKGSKASPSEADLADAEARRGETILGLLGLVCEMIKGTWDGGEVECSHWYPAAQAGIDAIFALAAQPLVLCSPMLAEMAVGLAIDPPTADSPAQYLSTLSSSRISRLFFALGHVALRTLAHTEALASRVKLLRIRAAEKREQGMSSGAGAAPAEPAPAAAGGKGKKGSAAAAAAAAGAGPGGAKDDIEAQLGVSAAEDEKEAELTLHIAEAEIAASNICGLFAPLLQKVLTGHLVSARAAAASGTVLKADALTESALLAMCKLMAVSASFCESHLQLLFTVLAQSPCSSLRGTIAVALGDLAVRYPNLTEPYTSHMYARLRDSDPGVRKSALMVLTHLILAEQIKVKGNVGEIAVCLNDEDQRIADLTRMFFTELSKRSGSPIYNLLPDTLSCLSKLANPQAHAAAATAKNTAGAGAGAGSSSSSSSSAGASNPDLSTTGTLRPLDQETFRDIVKFLLGFVSKDKQSEALAEKLLHRLESAENTTGAAAAASGAGAGAGASASSGGAGPVQGGVADEATKALWRDVSYCLSQLPLSDKTIRRMADGVRSYAPALADDDVWESFAGMLARARKMVVAGPGSGSTGAAAAEKSVGGMSKAELREVVDAWEKSLSEARSGSMEDDAALVNARKVSSRAKAIAKAAGINQESIAAEALTQAKEAAAAATAAAEAEAAAKKGSRGRAKATAAVGPGAGASALPPPVPKAKAGRKGIIDDEDDDEEEEAPVARKGRAGAASAASSRASSSARPPSGTAAASSGRRGIINDSDDEDEDEAQDENRGGAGGKVAGAKAAGNSRSRASSAASTGSAGAGGASGKTAVLSAGVGPTRRAARPSLGGSSVGSAAAIASLAVAPPVAPKRGAGKS